MAGRKTNTKQETKSAGIPKPLMGQAEPTEDTGQAEPTEDTGQPEPTEDMGQAEPDVENGEDIQDNPLPKVLTALRPILYLARQYKAGDTLPANNPEMVHAWVAAGSAEWREKKNGQPSP